jgi:hypothetical protein
MNDISVADWLRKKRRQEVCTELAVGVGGLVGGTCVFLLTATLLLFPVQIVTALIMGDFRAAVETSLIVTGFLLIILVGIALRSDRDDLSNLLAWAFREIIAAGPRMVWSGMQSLQRMFSFMQLDVEGCGKVLFYLATRRSSVSLTELTEAFPGGVWNKLPEQLHLLDGIVFLRRNPPRMLLTEPMRFLLSRIFRESIETAPGTVVEPEKLTPYELLGVSSSASLDDLKQAYRKRMKECHPDRFPGTDLKYRQMAEAWAKAVNAAYEALRREQSNRRTRFAAS